MPLKEKVPVVVEEHTKCKCDCRIKEGDCKRNQVYIKSQCKCECTNVDDHNKCLAVSRNLVTGCVTICVNKIICCRRVRKSGTQTIVLVGVEIQRNVRLERTTTKIRAAALG